MCRNSHGRRRRGPIPPLPDVRRAAAALLIAAAACNEAPTPPQQEPSIRTVLVHRQNTGENVLLNTDGSDAGAYAPVSGPFLPLGASSRTRVVVSLYGRAIVLNTVGTAKIDTILADAPASHSLASMSDDERLVALVSYAPTRGLIVYDRADRRADTLDYGAFDPVLPPVFSPANDRVVLFGLTDLSLIITTVDRANPANLTSVPLAVSRFINRPIFGWPRWVGSGIYMAFVRVARDAPDTLVVGLIRPDEPDERFNERYRVVMAPVSDNRPELSIAVSSTYAFTSDGLALALGAEPAKDSGRHAIYLANPEAPRVQLLRDDPAEFLVFPLFVRE